jgi:hypothetical protein
MLKRIVHIAVVSCLSVLLIFGSTAKEFVHLFAHHEDTIHNPQHVCPEGESHFEHEHHHCSFLHFVLEPFANDAFVPRITNLTPSSFSVKNSSVLAKFIPRSIDHIALRGPPNIAV